MFLNINMNITIDNHSLTWYCQFLLSGRFVSTIPPTLSILQCSLPAAMNLDSSLSEENHRHTIKITFSQGLC